MVFLKKSLYSSVSKLTFYLYLLVKLGIYHTQSLQIGVRSGMATGTRRSKQQEEQFAALMTVLHEQAEHQDCNAQQRHEELEEKLMQ